MLNLCFHPRSAHLLGTFRLLSCQMTNSKGHWDCSLIQLYCFVVSYVRSCSVLSWNILNPNCREWLTGLSVNTSLQTKNSGVFRFGRQWSTGREVKWLRLAPEFLKNSVVVVPWGCLLLSAIQAHVAFLWGKKELNHSEGAKFLHLPQKTTWERPLWISPAVLCIHQHRALMMTSCFIQHHSVDKAC